MGWELPEAGCQAPGSHLPTLAVHQDGSRGGGRREKLAQLSARANEMCSLWRGACDVRKDWLKTVSAFEACSVYVSVNIHPEVKRLALDPGSSRVCASEIDRGHKFLPVTVEGEEGLISPKNNII